MPSKNFVALRTVALHAFGIHITYQLIIRLTLPLGGRIGRAMRRAAIEVSRAIFPSNFLVSAIGKARRTTAIMGHFSWPSRTCDRRGQDNRAMIHG